MRRAAETLWFLLDPAGFFRSRERRAGPVFRTRTAMYGDTLVVGEPDVIRDVLARDPELYRGGEANLFLRPVVGARSVSCLDGAAHAARRRLVVPALHQGAAGLSRALPAIVLREIERLPLGRPVALQRPLRRITLAAALEVVLGRSPALEREAFATALTAIVDRGTAPFSQLVALPGLQRDLLGLSPWALFRRDLGRLDAAVRAAIATRRARGPDPGAPPDALDGLLAARDEAGRALGDAELRDDLVTLVGAGSDTTATAIAWLLERLLDDPDVHAGILAELRAGPLAPLPRLDAAIQETLRLHPVLPTFSRVACEESTIGGHAVRAGTRIMFCAYLAHRRPAIYPEPERFLPGRFLDARPPPHAFVPFGGGPRRCPGAAMALDEARVVAATLLSAFTLRPARPGPARPVFRGSTLAPAGGTRVVLERRSIS